MCPPIGNKNLSVGDRFIRQVEKPQTQTSQKCFFLLRDLKPQMLNGTGLFT